MIKKQRALLIAFAGLLICALNGTLTACMCGYLDFVSRPGSVIAVAVCCVPFFGAKEAGLARRVVIAACLIATALSLLKNIGDILWWATHL